MLYEVITLIEGKNRASIARFVKGKDFFQVELELIPETEVSAAEGEALRITSYNVCYTKLLRV